jgi:hypothetical protein
MLDNIRRWVGHLEKAHRIRMKPKSQAGTEGVVPVNPNGGGGPDADSMEEEEELSPEFIKRFTRLKWECLRTGVSLAVLQCPFQNLSYTNNRSRICRCIKLLLLSQDRKRDT